MITKLAIWWLTRQLRKDRGLWEVYQSSIAVTIQDEYGEYFKGDIQPRNSLPWQYLHSFSNKCAIRFLDMWTEKR